MSYLNTISLNLLLPFVEFCIVASLIAVLIRATMRTFFDDCGNPVANETCYGLTAIPQVKPAFPIIGNFPLLHERKNILKNVLKWCGQYGEIFKFCGLKQTFVFLNSAELVQTLLKSGDLGHTTKSEHVYSLFKPFITNGVVVSKGPFWQHQRKILMKSQSFSNLKACMSMMNKHGRKMVEDLKELYKDTKPKPANFLISRAFLCVISEMITGYGEESSGEIDRYHHNLQIGKDVFITRICRPWLLFDLFWSWNPMKKKNEEAVEYGFEFARRKLQKHKLDRQKFSVNNRSGGNGKSSSSSFRSVLDDLIDAGVDDQQILEEFNTMIVAGHETVAGSIQFFCLTMALNLECQEKCRQEIDALLQEKGEMALTFDEAQGGLKYLEHCILETLRLFPPGSIFFRELSSPLNLVHKGKNIVLPPGTHAVIYPFGLHRNPEYFPEPNTFNPDRFLPHETAKRSAYAYIPFSAGPRSCLGMKFAMLEMKVFAAYLIRNFEITTTDKIEDISLLPNVITTPERDYIFMFKERIVDY